MRKSIKTATLALVLAAGLSAPAAAQRAPGGEAERYRPEIEARFRAMALVPGDWRELPAQPDWEGRSFVSPDGNAWLAIYGAPQKDDRIDDHLRSVIQAAGEDITYLRHGRRWVVVSGYKGDRIFYRRAILSCGDKVWHHIALEYPAERKRAYDRLVTRVAASLAPAPGSCKSESEDPLVGMGDRSRRR